MELGLLTLGPVFILISKEAGQGPTGLLHAHGMWEGERTLIKSISHKATVYPISEVKWINVNDFAN